MWNVSPLLFFSVSPSVASCGLRLALAAEFYAMSVDARFSLCVAHAFEGCYKVSLGVVLLHAFELVFVHSLTACAIAKVLYLGYPFEVVCVVVGYHLVFMVHFLVFAISWHECESHKAMHVVKVFLVVGLIVEVYGFIPSFRLPLLQDAPFSQSLMCSAFHAWLFRIAVK